MMVEQVAYERRPAPVCAAHKYRPSNEQQAALARVGVEVERSSGEGFVPDRLGPAARGCDEFRRRRARELSRRQYGVERAFDVSDPRRGDRAWHRS